MGRSRSPGVNERHILRWRIWQIMEHVAVVSSLLDDASSSRQPRSPSDYCFLISSASWQNGSTSSKKPRHSGAGRTVLSNICKPVSEIDFLLWLY